MPGDTIPTTPAGWPYLDQDNYLDLTPEYTEQLADKLQNSDADVAAAINAAARAEAAATIAVSAAGRFAAGSGVVSTVSANSESTVVVSFPQSRFTSPPVVTISPTGASALKAKGIELSVSNVTATSFILYAFSTSASSLSSIGFNWLAVQL